MIFYTADNHLGHKKIIEYCDRPFDNIDEHDSKQISNWNNKVSSGDTVYVVGDFAFKNKDGTNNILKQLNGIKILIRGSHDCNVVKADWDSVHTRLEIKDGDHHVVMDHYPLLIWPRSHYGSIMLHGHCHGSLNKSAFGLKNIYDVGVDSRNFTPVTLKEILW